MKIGVSFCLYGDDPKYYVGARENARLVPALYGPDSRAVFYVTDPNFRADGMGDADIRWRSHPWVKNLMFLRLLLFSDPSYDVVLIRDCDSRITRREIVAVSEWLDSGYAVHVMRDHPHHSNIPMMGGMWGAWRESLIELLGMRVSSAIRNWESEPAQAAEPNDQIFLKERIWPKVREHTFQHDEFPNGRFGESHPFPLSAWDAHFVGEIIDSCGGRNAEHVAQWKQRHL